MSLEQKLIANAKIVWYEGFIAIGIGLLIVGNIVATDISFHDDYVGFIIEQCHPDNQSQFCQDIRDHLGVGITDQLEIGNNYWNRLLGQALELFVIMFVIRMAFGLMLQMAKVRKIRLTTVLISLVWASSATVIFTFGMVDTLYFVFQGLDIPDELPYLNEGLVFSETKSLSGDKFLVEKEDLFITNAIGFTILFGLIMGTAIVYNLRGYSNRTIA